MAVLTNPTIRRSMYRIGRRLYLTARLDVRNAIAANGESDLQSVVVANATVGDVILDVGANIGEWTDSLLSEAAQAGRQVVVHAFEPVPSTATVLAARLAPEIATGTVTLHRDAISNATGRATMYASQYDSGMSGTNSLLTQRDEVGTQEIDIRLLTLDDFARRIGVDRLLLVKSDTEGNDLNVIRGATNLLATERVMILQFEYNWRWVAAHSALKDVFDAIQDFNYIVGKILPGGLELYPDWHPELEHYFEGNYVILNRSAVEWFHTWTCVFDDSNRPVCIG